MADILAEIKRRAKEREARALNRGASGTSSASSETLIRSNSAQWGAQLVAKLIEMSQLVYLHECFQSSLMLKLLKPKVLRQFKRRCTVSVPSLSRLSPVRFCVSYQRGQRYLCGRDPKAQHQQRKQNIQPDRNRKNSLPKQQEEAQCERLCRDLEIWRCRDASTQKIAFEKPGSRAEFNTEACEASIEQSQHRGPAG